MAHPTCLKIQVARNPARRRRRLQRKRVLLSCLHFFQVQQLKDKVAELEDWVPTCWRGICVYAVYVSAKFTSLSFAP